MNREGGAWVGGLVLMVLVPSAATRAADRTSGTAARPRAEAPAGAPAGWLGQVQKELADREYDVSWHAAPVVEGVGPSWQAPNRAQGFRAYFAPEGIRVVPRAESGPSWRFGLSLIGYGQGGRSWAVPQASLAPSGHRIDYRRGAFEERYENTSRGLEQSFTLPAPPGEAVGGRVPAELEAWTTPLRRTAEAKLVTRSRGEDEDDSATPVLVHLDLALWGDLFPRIAEDGQAIDFITAGGAPVLRYAGLVVTDARGETLPAWMEGFAGEGIGGIRLVVDAAGATYPITIDPLATSAAWTAEGDQASASFGASVAPAGDVNGDGYSDVLVGASTYDNGQTDEGRAFLYLGSASGLAAAPAWTREGDQTVAEFGFSVAGAGDVNGDGYSDVVVGALYYSNGQTSEGGAFVYLGSPAGLAGTPAWSLEGNQDNAQFGGSVAGAGDVNDDGYGDLIVGAPGYSNAESGEGRAFLYLGSASGLATTPAWTADGGQIFANFGVSVATAGDVDGDGHSDVVVGADLYPYPIFGDPVGRAFLYRGTVSGLATTPAWTAGGNEFYGYFAHSVATAGDVNGDGYSDVIVGAFANSNGETSEGRAFVYLGSASGLDTTAAWTAESNQYFASFGISVATAGDVNGDGYADVIVGDVLYDNGQTDEGRASLYLGSAAGLDLTPAWRVDGNQDGASFGASVATAGDVNGDGYSDVLVGASGYDNGQSDEGRTFVYLGSPSGLVDTPAWEAVDDPFSEFGASVATAGDVNGDGYSDVIVGARSYDQIASDGGAVFAFLGSASGLANTAAWTAEGSQDSAYLGSSVATAGDVNGDGYSDVIVGANGDANGQFSEGRAFVYLGSASGLAATPAWTAEGDQDDADLGVSVATAGDVNGDGYSDVIVGADRFTNGQTSEGRAFVYLGSVSGLAAVPAWTAESNQGSAGFGFSVATAGDVNGDGYSDVIVGASLYSNGQTNEGRAFVYLGSGSGLAAAPAWTAESDQAGAKLGSSVATAGDVNGDGYSDVIVGAPDYDNSGPDVGRARLYLGSVSGLAPTPAWTKDGIDFALYHHFGTSVATAGDVDGDGYSDVIVTAPETFGLGTILVFPGSVSGPGQYPTYLIDCGYEVSAGAAGDVNGDGVSDLIVGCGSSAVAHLYYGNGGTALDRIPRQARSDGAAPIALYGKSDAETSFRLRARGFTPAGRGKVRLQWQVAPLGTALSGASLVSSAAQDTGAPGGSGSTVGLDAAVTGLTEGTFYHWRSRVVSADPFFPHSPWMSLQGDNVTETKLRTSGCVDRDGDGFGDFGDPSCASLVADCNSTNPSVWGTPGETANLVFTSPTTVTWDVPADPGALASSLVYDTLRSSTANGFLGATCVESDDGPNTTAADAAVPASSGQAFFYLTRVQSTCPSGTGSLGSSSSGTPRVGVACP